MSLLAQQARGRSVPVIPLALVIVAVLAVSIKYIGPILYYISERLAHRPMPDVPVMLDFWWPLFMIAAAGLYSQSRRARTLFIILAGCRSLWSIVVLTLFFAHPAWDFWQLQWLFCEIITFLVMALGLAVTLSSVIRNESVMRPRPVSITS